jgi:outer membrane lipoprotein LolB
MSTERFSRAVAWMAASAVTFSMSGCASWQALVPSESTTTAPPQAAVAASANTTSSQVTTVQANAPQQFSGRLSLRVHQPRTGATDGGTVLFEFDGTPEAGTLVLQTVIGTAVASARWSAQGAEIVTPRGRHTGDRLDDVAGVLLGQDLPLAAILQWVRAEPWPQAPHRSRAEGFEQLGWSISLEAWHERVVTAHRSARPDRPGELDITVRARLDQPEPNAEPAQR